MNDFKFTKDDAVDDELIQSFQEVFSLLDHDKDGVISVYDLKVILSKLNHDVSDEDVTDLMKQISQGGESLDLVDFINSVVKKNNNSLFEEECRSAFQVFDKNNDGILDFFEISNALDFIGEPLTNEEIMEILSKTSNPTGITYDELLGLFNSYQ
uniref:Calmodulin-like n=1 Tax=Dermatophagoides pteronyssinus TaxID=6956 RepID=A0A6P6XL28_DERPT|nr:calmodulin-like [Dermatophagoides pteronyssinus]